MRRRESLRPAASLASSPTKGAPVPDPEAPDADVQEQELVVDPTDVDPELPDVGIEVPDADALEQAQPVPLDEDEFR